ncbi:hypothetical protein SCOCK_50033 [Actinacidiphila cocklensis]|uniref:Uncharacterized protein n=1 Tax=Actinacidiphila cocklensis TaxID=887465 RepID=A0A9W4GTX6_9ACTN|nr:hypothetical protein SCOCK_50033 [Actinacidiphila cocklensis]
MAARAAGHRGAADRGPAAGGGGGGRRRVGAAQRVGVDGDAGGAGDADAAGAGGVRAARGVRLPAHRDRRDPGAQPVGDPAAGAPGARARAGPQAALPGRPAAAAAGDRAVHRRGAGRGPDGADEPARPRGDPVDRRRRQGERGAAAGVRPGEGGEADHRLRRQPAAGVGRHPLPAGQRRPVGGGVLRRLPHRCHGRGPGRGQRQGHGHLPGHQPGQALRRLPAGGRPRGALTGTASRRPPDMREPRPGRGDLAGAVTHDGLGGAASRC